MSGILPHVLALAGLSVSLAGCAATDPLYQPGHWTPTGANDMNLSAQIENPADLLSGRRSRGTDALAAAQAVDRLRQDKVKPLEDSGLSQIRVAPSSGTPDVGLAGGGGGL